MSTWCPTCVMPNGGVVGISGEPEFCDKQKMISREAARREFSNFTGDAPVVAPMSFYSYSNEVVSGSGRSVLPSSPAGSVRWAGYAKTGKRGR